MNSSPPQFYEFIKRLSHQLIDSFLREFINYEPSHPSCLVSGNGHESNLVDCGPRILLSNLSGTGKISEACDGKLMCGPEKKDQNDFACFVHQPQHVMKRCLLGLHGKPRKAHLATFQMILFLS